MALSQSELEILSFFLIGHPAIKGMTNSQIVTWLDGYGTQDLATITNYMTYSEKANLFKQEYQYFQFWYSDFCDSLAITSSSNVAGFTLDEVKEQEKILIATIVNAGLSEALLQVVILEFFRRSFYEGFASLLVCLRQHRVFSEHTFLVYSVELNRDEYQNQNKRYINLGLSALPSIGEVEAALNV